MLTLDINLLWTVINVIVLFLLLRKFLYKPVMNIIEQRQKQADAMLADAQAAKEKAQAALDDAQQQLRHVDEEAAHRREISEQQAAKEKEQLISAAHRQADAIVAEGRASAEAETARRLRQSDAELAGLARSMCEKLLERSITQEDSDRLLNDLLEKAGDDDGKHAEA